MVRACFFAALWPVFLEAQTLEHSAPQSPTAASTIIDHTNSDFIHSMKESPGLSLRDYGGTGKAQPMTIRGQNADDVSVTLEGIPLNSSGFGQFDFGMLPLFGLGTIQVARGGYAPLSTNPSGVIELKLPSERRRRFTLGAGSFQTYFVGQELPNANFYFEQSQNDFPYDGGTRSHNASSRLSLRGWLKEADWQSWIQILFSDQEQAGSLDFPSNAHSVTAHVTSTLQKRWQNSEFHIWAQYQDQHNDDPDFPPATTNRWWSLGSRGRYRSDAFFSDTTVFELTAEGTLDKLHRDTQPNTPLRQTGSLSLALLMSPTSAWVIHPWLRGEYVSDLKKEHFSIHPGMGARYFVLPSLSLFANLSRITRAPTFSEMYFQFLPLRIPNPHLGRQTVWQADIGYAWEGNLGHLRQTFFANRTVDLIEVVTISNISQAQNVGTGYSLGLENEIEWKLTKDYSFQAQYTIQKTRVAGRQKTYQPAHSLMAQAKWSNGNAGIEIPLYFRSSVRDSFTQTTVGPQIDLGVRAFIRFQRWIFNASVFNLLGQNREEVKGYPLSRYPWVRLSLGIDF